MYKHEGAPKQLTNNDRPVPGRYDSTEEANQATVSLTMVNGGSGSGPGTVYLSVCAACITVRSLGVL